MDKSFLKKILGQIYLKGITFSGVETTEEITEKLSFRSSDSFDSSCSNMDDYCNKNFPLKDLLRDCFQPGLVLNTETFPHAKQMVLDAGKEHRNQYLSTVEIGSFKEGFLNDSLHYGLYINSDNTFFSIFLPNVLISVVVRLCKDPVRQTG